MEENEPVERKRNTPPRGGRGEKTSRRYPTDFKLRAVKLRLEEGFSLAMVSEELGVTPDTVLRWTARYRQFGEAGLADLPTGPSGPKLPAAVSEQIFQIKTEHPSFGIKRISQWLSRWFLLRASPEAIRARLREKGLLGKAPRPRRNLTRPRFFERATPNQMWQSDIFTFRLGGRYAYLIGFMDDYSRFLVGADLFRSPTAQAVIEVYRVAAAEFSPPKEMLTDNGRQYTSWRGTSRFEAELQKDRVAHFKSRPHHPMTLGKIERFWASIWQEFLARAQFESFESARERIKLWIKYYNHKRPHQGIEGLCPADRYFEIASQLRKTLEAGIQDNLLELALRGQPKAPFYMVGRMEGQSVILRAEKGKLKLSIDNGNENKELVYDLKQNDQDPNAPDGGGPQRPGESPGGAGGVDGAVQGGGGVPPTGNPIHDLPALAAPGHGGDAAGPGERGEPGAGRSLEPTTPGPLAQPPTAHEHAQTHPTARTDPACQAAGESAKNGLDDPLAEAGQPHSAGPGRTADGSGSGTPVGDLTSGVLPVGEQSPERIARGPGGTTQGTTQAAPRSGERTPSEPGAATGREAAPL
jgi:transposase InsO family protein